MQSVNKVKTNINSGFFLHPKTGIDSIKIEANTLDEFESIFKIFSAINLMLKHTKKHKRNIVEELKLYPQLKFSHDKDELKIFFDNGGSVSFKADSYLSEKEEKMFYDFYEIEHITYMDENSNIFEIV